MLEELVVEGLGVIERAEVRLARGSTALTGETGAGKTLVVTAAGLLMGARGDKGVVRSGAPQGRVEGRFTLPPNHDVVPLLLAQGLLDEPPMGNVDLVATRSVSESGSKARINGHLVTLTTLADIVGRLIEIAGQNEHQRLVSGTNQRALLDASGGEEGLGLAAAVASSVRAANEARARAELLVQGERARTRDLDILRFEVAEIEAAALTPGEVERLSSEASRLEGAEAIASGITSAIAAIRDESGAEDLIGTAEQAVKDLAEKDPVLGEFAARLESARLELQDVASELAGRIIQPDPQALEEVRGRLDVISKLRRKYGNDEDAILGYLEQARNKIEALSSDDTDAAQWEERAKALRAEALEKAASLSEKRAKTAERLAREVAARLADLALPEARFEVELTAVDLYEGGLEQVSFRAALNAGDDFKPIAKAASGGELSRLALALNLCSSSAVAPTMIFDEVDSGVGGRAAQSVGRALTELAHGDRQVIVVTHLPQVAAFADNHLVVRKVLKGDRMHALVEPIADDSRVEELSRMLAGLPESEVGQLHARELLELAAGGAPAA